MRLSLGRAVDSHAQIRVQCMQHVQGQSRDISTEVRLTLYKNNTVKLGVGKEERFYLSEC